MGTFRETFDSAQIKHGWILNIMIHDFQQESLLLGVRFQFPATPWFFQGHRSIPANNAYPTHLATLMGPWLLLSRARYLVTNIHRGAPNNLGASKGHHAHYAPYLVGLELVKGNPSNSEWFVKKERWSTQTKFPQMVIIWSYKLTECLVKICEDTLWSNTSSRLWTWTLTVPPSYFI